MKYLSDQKKKRQSGSGVLEVILAVTILALGGSSLVTASHNVLKENRQIEHERHKNQLLKAVLHSSDCSQLKPCEGSELIELKDYDGKVLIRADGKSEYGPWATRAQCRPNSEIEVRVSLKTAKNKEGKSPLTGKVIDFTSPEGLLVESGVLCGKNVASPKKTKTVYGPQCVPSVSGTCPHPLGSAFKLCCEDGRDAAKPNCPAGSGEYLSFWDRQGDWGAHGQWVVLCK